MVWPVVAAAVVGGMLGEKRNQDQARAAEAQRKMQGAIARYSPWTGMKPDTSQIKDPDRMGNIMQGALTGARMGMQIPTGGAPGGAPGAPGAVPPGDPNPVQSGVYDKYAETGNDLDLWEAQQQAPSYSMPPNQSRMRSGVDRYATSPWGE